MGDQPPMVHACMVDREERMEAGGYRGFWVYRVCMPGRSISIPEMLHMCIVRFGMDEYEEVPKVQEGHVL